MTHVNCTVPTAGRIRDEFRESQLQHDRDFWFKKADQLQQELDNIFDHAKDHGRVELWRNGEKLELVHAKDRTSPAKP